MSAGALGSFGHMGDHLVKIRKILSSAMFCAAGLTALGPSAKADIIPVADPYFNQFPTGPTHPPNFPVGFLDGPGAPHPFLYFQICGPGCAFADDNVIGWTASSTFGPGVSGQYEIGTLPSSRFNSDPMINATTAEPIVVRAQNASESQIVAPTAVAGVTYTLDVDLGFATDAVDKALVSIVIGNDHSALATPLASDDKTEAQMQETGNWYDFETSYTATAADAGHSIEILLSSLNNGQGFAYFADVRLTDSLVTVNPLAAPEPATWAMMLIGFGGMAGVAVRRSFRRRSAVGQLA
jgi:PEP-CTERM motif